ncbi:hypothetical protein [Gluconacetobacter diazotrophicus]|uniref:hypothetical protein n=1 Tax=Gluconacetobacter diazotrophicus TaxID=33996 RepID=UPI0011A2F27A|nr:hypothetical protein [Gluconacetobacter diazotrophicus]
MSYFVESLRDMPDADLRAWALSRVNSGDVEIAIAEAERLIAWVLPERSALKGPRSASEPQSVEQYPAEDRTGFGYSGPASEKTSSSSSGGSDGESAGELPTPSRTKTAPGREDQQ